MTTTTARSKCGFPPCDETATHELRAACSCGHVGWDAKVCAAHLPECEAAARRLLQPPHYTVKVVELPRATVIANAHALLKGCP